MPRSLDIEWLRSICADRESEEWIEKIIAWRAEVLKHNRFIDDPTSFLLRLGQNVLRFNAPSSYSTIEVYHEIFRENAHFLAPGFSGEEARVILDIGANQGFYLLKLKEINPRCRIIAVEPNPWEYAVLCENIELNRITDVQTEKVAMAASGGEITLEVIPEIGAISGPSVRIPERPWIKDEFVKTLRVPAMPLDDLIEKHGIETVDILKLDVEGLECEILSASTRVRCVSRAVVEYHGLAMRPRLIQCLEEKGFQLIYEDPSHSNNYSGELYFRNQSL